MQTLFETARLIVREFEPADLSTIQDYAGKPEVVQYQKWGPNTIAHTRQFLQAAIAAQTEKPRASYELAIELKDEKRHIGGCGIFLNEHDLHSAFIGYIIHPGLWNCGYASEAVRGLLHYGLLHLQLKNIRATCDIRNIGSRRVLEKTGFSLLQTRENHFLQKGLMRTSLLFEKKIGMAHQTDTSHNL